MKSEKGIYQKNIITISISPEADLKLRETQVALRRQLLYQYANKQSTTLGKLVERMILRKDFEQLVTETYKG